LYNIFPTQDYQEDTILSKPVTRKRREDERTASTYLLRSRDLLPLKAEVRHLLGPAGQEQEYPAVQGLAVPHLLCDLQRAQNVLHHRPSPPVVKVISLNCGRSPVLTSLGSIKVMKRTRSKALQRLKDRDRATFRHAELALQIQRKINCLSHATNTRRLSPRHSKTPHYY
jgi:hypothetical protein